VTTCALRASDSAWRCATQHDCATGNWEAISPAISHRYRAHHSVWSIQSVALRRKKYCWLAQMNALLCQPTVKRRCRNGTHKNAKHTGHRLATHTAPPQSTAQGNSGHTVTHKASTIIRESVRTARRGITADTLGARTNCATWPRPAAARLRQFGQCGNRSASRHGSNAPILHNWR
jgi:hypothetical protein